MHTYRSGFTQAQLEQAALRGVLLRHLVSKLTNYSPRPSSIDCPHHKFTRPVSKYYVKITINKIKYCVLESSPQPSDSNSKS